MTKDDEVVMRLLAQAAGQAGYQVRMSPEGFVGVFGGAKVARLFEAAHALFVAELARRAPAKSATDFLVGPKREVCSVCGHWTDSAACQNGHP
jgi:hypothetical protein